MKSAISPTLWWTGLTAGPQHFCQWKRIRKPRGRSVYKGELCAQWHLSPKCDCGMIIRMPTLFRVRGRLSDISNQRRFLGGNGKLYRWKTSARFRICKGGKFACWVSQFSSKKRPGGLYPPANLFKIFMSCFSKIDIQSNSRRANCIKNAPSKTIYERKWGSG